MLSENTLKISCCIITFGIIVIMLIKRFLYFRPSSHFISFSESFRSIQHYHLNAWFFESPSDKVILFCQGNSGNMSNRESKIVSLKNLGYSVLIFDYSGYGKSLGVPSEQQVYDDGCLMMSLLRQTYQSEKIILYGESLGCAVATYVARRYGIQKLILESPVVKIQNIISYKFKLLSIFSCFFPEFDTESYLNGYVGKSMIIHSPSDDIIPYELTKNLRDLCTIHIQSSGSHNYQNIPYNEIQKFLSS